MANNWSDNFTYKDNILVATATIYNFQGTLVNIAEDIKSATNDKLKSRSIEILENLNFVIEDAITSMHNINNISVKQIGEILENDFLPFDLYE